MKNRLWILGGIVLLFAGMCVMENSAVRARPVEPHDNASAIYQLAGEFRTVFANLLWIKADKYHHEYIQHDPNWSNNKDLIGLLKMITALDPRFVEAYSVGTYILMNGYHNNIRAMNYLMEGLEANPRSRELNQLAAVMYAYKLKNPRRALPYAQRAVWFAEDDFNLHVTKRNLKSIQNMISELEDQPADPPTQSQQLQQHQ